jgi:uncharacterized membrane protein YeaQ/YmgE (transglycosylase-associated protein family)
MKSDGAEYAGWIIGAVLGFFASLLVGDDLLIGIVFTFIGAIVGGAVGYVAGMMRR